MIETVLIYLGKSSLLLLLFWVTYKLALEKTTHFRWIRWHFLAGWILAFLLPLWEVVRTEVVTIQPSVSTPESSVGIPSEGTDINILVLGAGVVLGMGALLFMLRFLIQLTSVFQLLKRSRKKPVPPFIHVLTEKDQGAFSFFRYVFFNPTSLAEAELSSILAHEYSHARGKHTADILVGRLTLILLWWNPMAWWYLKNAEQNLEFLADQEALATQTDLKAYQYLLLQQGLGRPLSISNSFNHSSIKKRIVMLHQSPSKRSALVRFALVLPLVAFFFMSFQVRTETVYEVIPSEGIQKEMTSEVDIQQSDFYVLTENASENDIASLKKKISAKGGSLQLKKVQRNGDGLITRAALTFSLGDGMVSGSYDNPEGIGKVVFGQRAGGGLFLSQGNEDVSWETEDVTLDNSSGENRIVVVNRGKKSGKPVVWTAEGNAEEVVEVVVDKDTVTNKKVFFVYKGDADEGDTEKKVEKIVYRKVGKDTVHLVREEKIKTMVIDDTMIIDDMDASAGGKVRIRSSEMGNPLIVIDGKETTREEMNTIAPDNIARIEVLKGDKAIEKYGDKAKDGVIMIFTKDEK